MHILPNLRCICMVYRQNPTLHLKVAALDDLWRMFSHGHGSLYLCFVRVSCAMLGIYVCLFLFGVLFLYCGEILRESVRYLQGASQHFVIFYILSLFDDYNVILLWL